jgi:hypothetical protein
VQIFRAATRELFLYARRALLLQNESKRTAVQVQADREAIEKVIPSLKSSLENITRFQSAITRLPAFTSKLRNARKRAASVLGDLVAEIQYALDQNGEMVEIIVSSPKNSLQDGNRR